VIEDQGEKWVFVEGSEAGYLLSNAIIEQKGSGASKPPLAPPSLPLVSADRKLPLPGMKEEKNSLDEGEAVLTLPENLSADSVRDLEYWLKGVPRKAKRRAGITDDEAAH